MPTSEYPDRGDEVKTWLAGSQTENGQQRGGVGHGFKEGCEAKLECKLKRNTTLPRLTHI